MGVRAARLLALGVVAVLGLAARQPSEDIASSEVAARFGFASTTLDHRFGIALRQTRDVHRELAHIQPWIASVGAAAALGDVDGNLKSDDICYVDTRINQVIVAPVVGERFPPFMLQAPGTDATMAPMGCLIGDLNEDGLADLLVYYWGRPPVAFLRTDAGQARPGTPPRGIDYRPINIAGEQRWFTNAAVLSDIDGDGHLDLVIGNYFCDDGRILDSRTTEPVCPHPVMQDSMSRAYNGGVNRILLWRAGGGGAQPSVEFKDSSGVFTPEVAGGWTLAIGAQDLNGDSLPDLYFANDFGPDRLLINCSAALPKSREELGCFPLQGALSFRLMHGAKGLTKPNSKVLGRDSFKGMGVDFADIDGDGLADIFVSNITERWALQESHFLFLSGNRKIDAAAIKSGIAPYIDNSEQLGLSRSGWAWDAKFADFDNDGSMEALQAVGFVRGRQAGDSLSWRKSCWAMLQELATANDLLLKHSAAWFNMEHDASGVGCDLSGSNRNPFFVRAASGRFVDVSPRLPHIDHGQPAPTRGLAMADVDLDGRIDYVEARQFAAPSLHMNTSAAARSHAFISLSPRFLIGDSGASGGGPFAGYLTPSEGDRNLAAWGRSRVTTMDEAASIRQRSRPAIGVRLKITLADGRSFVREVDGGNGHSGKRSPEIHIGLGPIADAGSEAQAEVSWRVGAVVKAERFTLQIGRPQVLLIQP